MSVDTTMHVPDHIISSSPIEDFKAFLLDLREHHDKHTELTTVFSFRGVLLNERIESRNV